MTKALSTLHLAERIRQLVPDAVTELTENDIYVKPEEVLNVAGFLKKTPDLEFDYLNSVTGVDYYPDYLEVVYHLTSILHNHSLVLKTKVNRENPVVPSVYSLWQGADLQEREVFDLMGIRFEGHPNLKRVLLWEGFEGHPLRKDYSY